MITLGDALASAGVVNTFSSAQPHPSRPKSPVHRGQSASTMARGPSPPPQSTCSSRERAIEWQQRTGWTRPSTARQGRTVRRTCTPRARRTLLSGRQRRHANIRRARLNQPRPAIRVTLVRSRPVRPAPHGAGRQAEASRRGVAIGPRGCQAVPRAGAARPKARHDFVFSQVFSP